MGEQPPRDGDDIWSDVLEQVAQALGDVDLGEDGTRDALIDGVRQALDGLDSTIDLDIEVVTDGATEPQVSIVEGGRSDADPITPGEKPDLRVADLPEDGSTDDVELDALRAARRHTVAGRKASGGCRRRSRLNSPDGLAPRNSKRL